jgi:hypothetical protein
MNMIHGCFKIPQLIAGRLMRVYVKRKEEDFMTLLSGIMGQKNTTFT